MLRAVFLFFVLTFTNLLRLSAQLPFKYDNTVYKAVYLNEAFQLMEAEPAFLLLDVRSPGEFADTSRHTALNIGKLRGAVNIDIETIPSKLPELKQYQHTPVFIYCSHSQRSRRVSKLLVENGFQKVYNINGGMSVVNESGPAVFPYKEKALVTSTVYKNVAGEEAIQLLQQHPDLLIIDIRTQKEFNSQDSAIENNIGRFRDAINIPQQEFAEKFASLNLKPGRPVLIYDRQGYNSMDIMEPLQAAGFTQLYNLFEGFGAFIADHQLTPAMKKKWLTDQAAYSIIDPKQAMDWLMANTGTIVLDARTKEEFENKSSLEYLNLGHIRNAIAVSQADSLPAILSGKPRNTAFLVYGSNTSAGFKLSAALVKAGYSNVRLMACGLYRYVWSTANIEECRAGRSLLVNHDGLY